MGSGRRIGAPWPVAVKRGSRGASLTPRRGPGAAGLSSSVAAFDIMDRAKASAFLGGLLQLTRYMACQLAPRRVRVNSLRPGIFPWPQVETDHPDFVGRVSANTPMGRPGRAEEIGGPAVFLASDAASYAPGADLRIDGGWVAQ